MKHLFGEVLFREVLYTEEVAERNCQILNDSCSSTFEDNWLSNGPLTAPPLTLWISKITSKDWLSNGSLTAPLLTKSDRELFDDFDQMIPSLHNSMVNGGATDLDVLSGRGAMTNAHPGNIRYRKLIEDYKPEHAALTSKQKKCAFTVRVMEEIKGYGGRFLTKACENGPWVLLDSVKKPNAARKKISQSLRE